MAGRTYNSKTVLFIVIGVVLLVGLDRLFGLPNPTLPPGPAPVPKIQPAPQAVNVPPAVPAPPSVPTNADPAVARNQALNFASAMALSAPAPHLPSAAEVPAWQKYAVPSTVPKNVPRIALIIDDMGLDVKHSHEAMDLPAPVTLSFMPYARHLDVQTAYARSKGHELMLHMPMEPENTKLDAGPEVLKPGLPPAQFDKVVNDDLQSFSGYVGINNHMGSLMTQDRPGMARLMQVLKERGLLFVDSRTIAGSVAAAEAEKAGVPYAVRNIFVDNEETDTAIDGSLAKAERYALKHGLAVVIGHPRAKSLAQMKEWLPTLKEKGIYLVPVSAIVTVPAASEKP